MMNGKISNCLPCNAYVHFIRITTETEKGTKGRGRGDYCDGSLAVKGKMY